MSGKDNNNTGCLVIGLLIVGGLWWFLSTTNSSPLASRSVTPNSAASLGSSSSGGSGLDSIGDDIPALDPTLTAIVLSSTPLPDTEENYPTTPITSVPTAAFKKPFSEATIADCYLVIKDANLRAGPSTNFEVIGSASAGDCLALSGRTADATWLAFDDNELFGLGVTVWIWRQLVKGDTSFLPVVSFPTQQSVPKATLAALMPTPVGCAGGCTVYPSWCSIVIKGNVAFESQERIYHVPGQEYYDVTRISPEYGERWFCTEAEAQAAGWRKAFN